MGRRKASDFPQELLDLFDGYVHGEISRRDFLDGAQKFAVGGATAASLFQTLKPNYAWAIRTIRANRRGFRAGRNPRNSGRLVRRVAVCEPNSGRSPAFCG